jgi:hypothetical protein
MSERLGQFSAARELFDIRADPFLNFLCHGCAMVIDRVIREIEAIVLARSEI